MLSSEGTRLCCPACRSSHVQRTSYEGILEQALLPLLKIGSFACDSCHLRFYMFLLPSKSRTAEMARALPARGTM